ncbi:MAG: hypothetical protein ACTHKN_07140 [Achromobacter mucicolens]
MMNSGFQVMTGTGQLIVDSSSINMFLRHAGVANTDVTVPADDPVVFIRPLASPCYLRLANLVDGQLHLSFRSACEYYVFDRPVEPSYLDAFNEAGTQIFTAAQRPLDIVGSVTVADYYAAYRLAYQDGWTYSGLVSGKYAYNQSYIRQGFHCQPYALGGWISYMVMETLTPTPNGFRASFDEWSTPFIGWAPVRANAFVSYAPSVEVSIIDVAGIL